MLKSQGSTVHQVAITEATTRFVQLNSKDFKLDKLAKTYRRILGVGRICSSMSAGARDVTVSQYGTFLYRKIVALLWYGTATGHIIASKKVSLQLAIKQSCFCSCRSISSFFCGSQPAFFFS